MIGPAINALAKLGERLQTAGFTGYRLTEVAHAITGLIDQDQRTRKIINNPVRKK